MQLSYRSSTRALHKFGMLVLFIALALTASGGVSSASPAERAASSNSVIVSAEWYNKSLDYKRIRAKVQIAEPAVVTAKWYIHYKFHGKIREFLLDKTGTDKQSPAGTVQLNGYLGHDAFNESDKLIGFNRTLSSLGASMIMRISAVTSAGQTQTVALTRTGFNSRKPVSL